MREREGAGELLSRSYTFPPHHHHHPKGKNNKILPEKKIK
jgi:hypothetical protein